jgi:hypothetical protein
MNYINSCIKTIQLYYEVDFVINAALNSDWVMISLYVSLGSHRHGTLEGNLAYVPVIDPGFGSWHKHSPTNIHWFVVKCILHYLNWFSNSDWVGSIKDWKSTNGYTIFLDRNLISRKTYCCSVFYKGRVQGHC